MVSEGGLLPTQGGSAAGKSHRTTWSRQAQEGRQEEEQDRGRRQERIVQVQGRRHPHQGPFSDESEGGDCQALQAACTEVQEMIQEEGGQERDKKTEKEARVE